MTTTDADLERENAALRQRLTDAENLYAAIQRPATPTERDQLATTQARADSLAAKFGEHAPAPMPGERPDNFRRRVLSGLKKFSPQFADFDVARADDALLAVAEPAIYEAAEAVAHAGTATTAALVKVEEADSTGRKITRYYGDNLAWMAPFMSGGQIVRINRP
ncbi:MAG: hypothetical protein ACREEL_00095 [Stellaceae bacterium]